MKRSVVVARDKQVMAFGKNERKWPLQIQRLKWLA